MFYKDDTLPFSSTVSCYSVTQMDHHQETEAPVKINARNSQLHEKKIWGHDKRIVGKNRETLSICNIKSISVQERIDNKYYKTKNSNRVWIREQNGKHNADEVDKKMLYTDTQTYICFCIQIIYNIIMTKMWKLEWNVSIGLEKNLKKEVGMRCYQNQMCRVKQLL